MAIEVGGKFIGEDCLVFVIAEIGSNWRTLDDCLHSIAMAKQCGADAVKFQLFNSTALYGIVPPWHFQDGVMDPTWLPILKAKADACRIEFMCSAFSPELLDAVNPYVNIHKVASAEMTHVRMLEKLYEYDKPVLLSTGASSEDDIAKALKVLSCETVLMYCVSAYPARVVDLTTIGALQKKFGLPVGYSDHTTDVLEIPRHAVVEGACVIEKHVTFIKDETPDSPHSLNAEEFKLMVKAVKAQSNPYASIPKGKIGPTPEEKGMLLMHNRRIIATCDIGADERLIEGKNFGIYRALQPETHAFSPFMIGSLKGSVTTRKILAGRGIGPGDVREGGMFD